MTCRAQAQASRTVDPAGLGRFEPAFREVLRDPIVPTLMARDGVSGGGIRYLMDLVRGLNERAAEPKAA